MEWLCLGKILEIHVNTIIGLGRTGGEEGFLVGDHCIKVHDAVRLIGKVYGSLHPKTRRGFEPGPEEY